MALLISSYESLSTLNSPTQLAARSDQCSKAVKASGPCDVTGDHLTFIASPELSKPFWLPFIACTSRSTYKKTNIPQRRCVNTWGGGNWACDQWKRQKVCDKCKSQLNKKRLTHGKQWVCDKYEINGGVRKKNHL